MPAYGPWMTHSGRPGAGPLIGEYPILPPASLIAGGCHVYKEESESLEFRSAGTGRSGRATDHSERFGAHIGRGAFEWPRPALRQRVAGVTGVGRRKP
jgi:hypothetical protein